MNYFELFEIPVSLSVDRTSITRRFFELQKKYHPDFYGQSNADEQEEALEISSTINKAFKVFQNQEATVKYVLQLNGLLEEEEKYQLDPTFLMEVMDLNEMKMDGADPAAIANRVNTLQTEIRNEVADILDHYDAQKHPEKDLLKVKEWYFKKKYLDRLLAE